MQPTSGMPIVVRDDIGEPDLFVRAAPTHLDPRLRPTDRLRSSDRRDADGANGEEDRGTLKSIGD
jgi:hypothetical protein